MTNFDKFKETVTVEDLAKMTVKLVIINNNELYYVTTTGQLYPMTNEGFKSAVEHEIMFWNTDIKEENTVESKDQV